MTAAPNTAHREFATLRISGNDRVSFLQGQLTQDIELLAPDNPLPAGWNSAKGRLLCICWLVAWQESIWMLLPAELLPNVLRRLRMYVLRADVQIDESPLQVGFTGSINSENIDVNHCFNADYYQVRTAQQCSLSLGGYPADQQVTPQEWRAGHIRAGQPWIWQETAEEFVPQMVNLDLLGGISFSKGCYVGQEIIARTQNLGRIKRRMYRFVCAENEAPAPGSLIYANQAKSGQVVDAVCDASGTDLLAVMRIEALTGELRLGAPDGPMLETAALPYPVPEAI